jgi:RHS repeat-associated protein
VTDARGSVTSYTYDTMDRLATRTDPLLRPESYVHDSQGNFVLVTDRKGQATQTTVDALDRPTQVLYQDGSTTSYTWDAGNRLTQLVDSLSGTITRAYDGLNQLVQETTPQGTVSYGYDAAGRRTSMTASGQAAVSYSYDAADRLTQITQGSATVAFSYDDANRRTSLTLPNGTVTEYSYDAAARLTGLTYKNGSTVLGTLTYSYDAAGNQTVIGGTWAATGLPQPVSSATYDAANQQLTFGTQALTYDANGSLIGDGVNTYTWDARNRLVAINGASLTASFGYDALGRRWSNAVNATSTQFLYDGLNPVQEQGAGTTANLLTGLAIDEYLTRTDATGTRAFLTDALGSALALTDDMGAVQTQYTYEPFGAASLTGTADANPFQYTGRENDGTGLYYYRARYYHPTLQRFLSEDPIGFEGGDVNLYGYVANNPLTFIDPLGLDKDQCPQGGGGWRLADFVSASASVSIPTRWTGRVLSWTGSVSVDRYGNWYWSPIGPGAGRAPYIGSGTLTANWLVQRCKPTQDQLSNFLSGHGFAGALGWWGGGNVMYSPGNGAAVGGGFVSPQAGGNYSYSFQGRGNTGWSW